MKKLIGFCILFYCISCNHTTAFEEYKILKDEEWCINTPARFEIGITEAGTYNLCTGIRHTTDYEMANLWCFITISDSSSVILRDTLNFILAEPDGRWLGKGFTLKNMEKPLKKNIHFQPGNYTCEIEQGMRIKCLKGIKNIGFIVKKAEE